MRDGIDQRAFSAEIKAMAPDARRQRMREVGDWMRAASRAAGWLPYLGIALIGIEIVMVVVAFAIHPPTPARALLSISFVPLLIGLGLSLWSNRRAREWRRTHPFEQWRASDERVG